MSNNALQWTDHAIWGRWHEIWLSHLALQMEANPSHPGHEQIDGRDALAAYQAAQPRTEHDWLHYRYRVLFHQKVCQHEVVAALRAYNERANRNELHLGLTSSDVTEVGVHLGINRCLGELVEQAVDISNALAHKAGDYRGYEILGRTHGRPAQIISYGHRIATVLEPLRQVLDDQPWLALRPPGGAVGHSADLLRVLYGWGRAEVEVVEDPWKVIRKYAYDLSMRLGWPPTLQTTRQVPHRSQELTVLHWLVQLASVAQTWSTDRRLEALQGLGNQRQMSPQVGSSAMAQKINPLLAERVAALAALMPGYYLQLTTLAHNEWLEGDVSSSAGRKLLWPAALRTAQEMLSAWHTAIEFWEPDFEAMDHEIEYHRDEAQSGRYLQVLMEQRGVGRTEAHEMLRVAYRDGDAKLFESLDEGDDPWRVGLGLGIASPGGWADR